MKAQQEGLLSIASFDCGGKNCNVMVNNQTFLGESKREETSSLVIRNHEIGLAICFSQEKSKGFDDHHSFSRCSVVELANQKYKRYKSELPETALVTLSADLFNSFSAT
ncbi:MAG: hypothetical protein ACFFGZ_19550 [Candidatus Thorarchaeota archaeon]